jgi:hypothetical protein
MPPSPWLPLEAAAIEISDDAVASGLQSVEWPARFQLWDKTIIIDGAHNPASARILAQTWREQFGADRGIVVLAILRDKNAAAIVDALRPIATKFLLPYIRSERALPPHDLASIFSFKTPSLPHSITPSLAEALTAARTTKERILITGSLISPAKRSHFCAVNRMRWKNARNKGPSGVLFRVAHASRVLAMASSPSLTFLQRLFRRDAETNWLASGPSLDVSSLSSTDCAFHLSFNPRKQRHWFSHHMSIWQLPPPRFRE